MNAIAMMINGRTPKALGPAILDSSIVQADRMIG
jgi:hypothetical protein